MNYIEDEQIFLSEFELQWRSFIEGVQISQVQLSIGNRLRPRLVRWGYLAATAGENISYVLPASMALSIEAIHKASLLLDDWIDNDDGRHGQPAFHVQFSPYETIMTALHLVNASLHRHLALREDTDTPALHGKSWRDFIIDTLYHMSLGALNELRLNEKSIIDVKVVKKISEFETYRILGNALQLGYYTGRGNHDEVYKLFEKIGDGCGYIFQAFNDFEAYGNSVKLSGHKGCVNYDINKKRKNLCVAILYDVASAKDKKAIEALSALDLLSLMGKYRIKDFLMEEAEMTFKFIRQWIVELTGYGISSEWGLQFSCFLSNLRKQVATKLSAND